MEEEVIEVTEEIEEIEGIEQKEVETEQTEVIEQREVETEQTEQTEVIEVIEGILQEESLAKEDVSTAEKTVTGLETVLMKAEEIDASIAEEMVT